MRPHLIDATLFYTPTSGGVKRYLLAKHAWIKANTRLHHTIVVPGQVDQGHYDDLVTFASPRLRAGYRCPVRLLTLRNTLRDLKPDLLEAGDPYLMGWQVARVSADHSIPSIAFCHSDVITLAKTHLGSIGTRIVSRYLRNLYQRFDVVMAPSQLVARVLTDAHIRPVQVQPLGVDVDMFTPIGTQIDLRQQLHLADNSRLLVFAGRLASEKNINDLLAMMGFLGDQYHLILIGGVTERRLNARVTILPYAHDASELATLLRSCDLLVHAGRQETFGLIALEAMACELPVVVYPGGALAELVDERVGALATDVTPRALAMAVHALHEAPSLRTLGMSGREKVLLRYSWDVIFRQQMTHYAHLLQRGSLIHTPPPAQPVTATP